MKKTIYIFSISMIILSTFFISNNIISSKDHVSLIKNINICYTKEWKPGSILPNGTVYTISESELHAKIYCLNYYLEQAKTIDFMQLITNDIVLENKKNKELSYLCHDFLHEIGYTSYKKFKDNAFLKGLDYCGWGYYHGLMQSTLKNSNKDNKKNLDNLINFCYMLSANAEKIDNMVTIDKNESKINDGYNNEDIDLTKFIFCGHGIGHSIGEKSNNLSEIAELCTFIDIISKENYKTIANKYNKLDTKIDEECFSGAMNSVMTRNIFRNEKVAFEKTINGSHEKIDDIISECGILSKINHKLISNCIRYALTYSNIIKKEEIIKYCSKLQFEKENIYIISGCYAGLGHKEANYLIKKNELELESNYKEGILTRRGVDISNIINTTCQSEISSFCTERFALETLQLLGDSKDMFIICNKILNKNHKDSCIKSVSRMSKIQDK